MTTQSAPSEQFRAAYRMVRTAYRGAARRSLTVDLQQPADYSPACRRCDAGRAVVAKVTAAIGSSDSLAICFNGQAVMIALGMPPHRQRGMPRPLDFDGWIAWRAWAADVRQAA